MSEENKNFNLVVLFQPEVIKAGEDEKFIGFIEGVASTPDIDLEGDKFLPEVLARNAESLKGKPILLLHGRNKEVGDQPIGEIIEAKFENGALKIKAGIYKAFNWLWDKIKAGILKALSIGGIIKKMRREGNINIIEDAEIREVSLTPRGMNPFAQIINVFGKSFVVDDDGLLKEIIKVEPEKAMSVEAQGKTFEKVDYDLPIVKREEWDGDAAAARIFKWAEKEDGTIDKIKASKLFLRVEGDGTKRGDYSWPVGDIVDGKPVLVTSGIITAIKYAAGARGIKAPPEVKNALERLVARLKREGHLPEDYEVPWEREKAIIETLYPMIADARSLEKIENKAEVEKSEVREEPVKAEEARPQEAKPKAEKGMAVPDEVVKKPDEVKHVWSPSSAPLLYKLYRELYGEVSD
jgi:hypothetical protein